MSKGFYTVRKGDNLEDISRRHGTSIAQLQKINGIQDPDTIYEGQVIALKAKAVCKVDVQLLDRDRNPLQNAKIRLDYSGKSKQHSSGNNGRLPSILTDSPEDKVKIYAARLDGSWKQIAEITSGWGNKLVTLISPKIKIVTKTMPHPSDAKGSPKPDLVRADKRPAIPADNPKATEAKGESLGDYGDGKGPKSEHQTDKGGLPILKITNDQVELDFLGGYTGEQITEEDYENAAKALGCEVAAIKAVAEVETGEMKDGFDKKKRPIILYERHIFAKCTMPKNKYNKINPDISSNKTYKFKTPQNKRLVKEGVLNDYDLYGDSYGRLAKAYSLDKNAALKACSWGKFQILGQNHKEAGFETVLSFVQSMCLSEREHLKAFASFVDADTVKRNALINKDWTTFAKSYNGVGYRVNRYDTRLQEAYNKYDQ